MYSTRTTPTVLFCPSCGESPAEIGYLTILLLDKMKENEFFKGIVQPFKTGVMGGIIRLAFKFSAFPQFF
jgi:hypothetical protein